MSFQQKIHLKSIWERTLYLHKFRGYFSLHIGTYILPHKFGLALGTLDLHRLFMFLLVIPQLSASVGNKVALATNILDVFVFALYVSLEVVLSRSSILALVTFKWLLSWKDQKKNVLLRLLFDMSWIKTMNLFQVNKQKRWHICTVYPYRESIQMSNQSLLS